MQGTESVVVKVARPTNRKAEWLAQTADNFSQAVQFALDVAQDLHTSSRGKIHKAAYHEIRERFDLPADYARMAINAAVSLTRSFYGHLKSEYQRRTSFPNVKGSQGIGLGVNAYKLILDGERWALRVSTGRRGQYIWLPLCVPKKFHDQLEIAYGDARLFQRGDDWYIMLPIRRSTSVPPVCDGEPTFLGIDLGIVRIATVATPDRVLFFDGKAVRHRREHFADLRRRYQRANRLDRIKRAKGKERCWMRDVNHKISRQIVDAVLEYDQPVVVFERLDGIRYRTHGSKRFNRMMSSWAFRQLVDFVKYKAEREGIQVIFVDPRGTSKTCPRCGHASRANRPKQSQFRCVSCDYQGNADAVAALNIAARGLEVYGQEPSDTAQDT